MSKTRWSRIEALFHGALEQPAEQREAWLQAQAGTDPALLEEVARLLACSGDETRTIDQVVSRAAADFSHPGLGEDRRLGPYRIVRRIGQGGMGEVYLAERDDQEYSQRVAIKVIRGFAGEGAMERFRRERQILAELQHPNIARLLDGGTIEDGQPYLVMDFIDGQALRAWLRERSPGLEARVRMMMALCDAIHHAHQHLIIHRDIKPGNVLVTEQGEPVLVDFGIARALDDVEPDADEVGYTPGFASPEQLAGQAVTTASDIYSLGRLFEVLAREGQAPEARLPRDLCAILEMATREDPGSRYLSAAGLRADLLRFLERRPVLARPATPVYQASRFLRRHRAMAVLATAAGLLMAVVSWGWLDDNRRARDAESRALIEARHGEQVLDFLLDAIAAAEPGQSRGRDVSVREIVDRSYARVTRGSDLAPELRARMALALGEVYVRLEDHERAVELLELAGLSEVPATRLRARSLLGYQLIISEEIDAAGPVLAGVDEMIEAYPDLPSSVINEGRNHHALWLLEVGQAESAATVFAELVDVHRRSGDEVAAGRMLHNLALAENAKGDWESAASHFRASLVAKQRTGMADTPSYAVTLSLLAQAQVRLGDYEAARQSMQASMDLRVRIFGADHPGLHHDYNEQGSMFHDRGRFDEAIGAYRRAIELQAISGGPEIESASYLNNLASAHEDRGELAQAEPLFRQSLALREQALGPEHVSVARARHNLARLLIRTGRFDEAEALIDQAVAGWTSQRGEGHPATLYSQSLYGFLAWARGDYQGAAERLDAVHEALSAHLQPTNWWMLTIRGQRIRNWIELGELARARAELEALLGDYGRALGEDHPLAAAWALEGVRIDRLQGEHASADERLIELAPLVEEHLAPGSYAARQLQCLRRGDVLRECWFQRDS